MKRFLSLILCLLLISLYGCAKNTKKPPAPPQETEPEITESGETQAEKETEAATAAETEKETAEETEAETTPEETDAVSPLATKDYMLPFENYSWEKENPIEYIVIHFVSDVVNSKQEPYSIEKVKNIFMQTEVSTNYIIDRDGSIICFIPEDRSAWHAGAGTYGGDERLTNKMNKYSIGIEILAIGSQTDMAAYLSPDEYNSVPKELIGFTDEQYASLKTLIEDICQRHSIEFDREHIIGHSEYNGKKSDPGELFDWSKLFG